MQVERVTEARDLVGESPVWRAAESALYWVDIPSRQIRRLDVETGALEGWTSAEMAACIAFDAEGALIAGMESGIFSLRLAARGAIWAKRLAALQMPLPDMRCNDGRCDRQGRFWTGTMHMDMPAAHAVGGLYRYTLDDGLSGPVVDGLLTQNGLAFSPRGDIMYLSDSHPKSRQIWRFDYDVVTGTPTNRRLFVDMNQFPGRPDGAAVDVDGCYWICANDGGAVFRFTPAGQLDRTIALPVKKPSMCAFGGSSLDTLYITSIRPQQTDALAAQPLAGAVFAARPGIQGMAETEFGATTNDSQKPAEAGVSW